LGDLGRIAPNVPRRPVKPPIAGTITNQLNRSLLRCEEGILVAHGRKIAVIGLGYVGLPVAVAFARSGIPVVGFDIDKTRIAELKSGHDRTREVEEPDLRQPSLTYTSDAAALKAADFHIVTVPTPIDAANRPDLTAMLKASESVGSVLKRGDIVVYESTVYPGAVEEECVLVLEAKSGLKAGSDFTVGYSPERINPGDKQHRFETIKKVVSAQDAKTLDIVAEVYGSVVTAGIHRAPSIKVAEAAKVIENTQRDLNIAFMNELSAIFHQLGIDTGDVLAAAATKWNFLTYQPGLVGGHCIGVDPYYLTYRAEKAGYHPEIILAGRRINDGMGQRVAQECVRSLMLRNVSNATATVLGVTFKENVPDIRNSKVIDIVRELERFGIRVQVHDPLALADETKHEYGVELTAMDALKPADAIVFAVAHGDYVSQGWPLITRLLKGGEGTVIDVKSRLDRACKPEGIDLWRL
jgi:UDP-N-acetyl-D-galactosamine dehydrogenase